MRSSSAGVTAALLLQPWQTAIAQPTPAERSLGEVSVSASRSERQVDLTPKPVTIVPREQIIQRPLANVQQILGDTPGISYSRAGGAGGQLVMRGLNSNDPRMVLFIDGDRFRGRNTLEYNFLDPSEIERIEIVRGPASALYGSDAMAGVINVITRRAKGDPSQGFKLTPRIAALGYESASQLRAGRVEVQGVGNGFDALVGLNWRRAGDYESAAGTIPNSDFNAQALTARVGFSPDATRRFELAARINRTESGRAGGIIGAPGAPLLTVREDHNDEDYLRLSYGQTKLAPWLDGVEVSLYRRELNTDIFTEDRTAANGNVALRRSFVAGPVLYGGKAIARSSAGDALLTYGLDFFHEDRAGTENDARTFNAAGAALANAPRAKRVRDATQWNAGAFVNADWDPSPQWTLSLSARHDEVRTQLDSTAATGETPALSVAFARNLSARDRATTGGAGLIFRPIKPLHLVANVATAFRAPGTFEKFGGSVAGAVTTLPNPDLTPERSTNYELGFRVRLPQLSLNATAFRSDYRDLIQTEVINSITRQRRNTGQARLDGAEIDGSYALTSSLALRFNASKVRGTNTQTGQPLPYVPPLNGLLALRHGASADFIEVAVRAYSAKERIDARQERRTPGYATFSLYGGMDLARWAPSLKGYRLALGIENLFDKGYANPTTQENIAFPRSITNPLLAPGRSFVVNLVGAL